jgi:lysocardiolipin and lysophospholipid acyltransferase
MLHMELQLTSKHGLSLRQAYQRENGLPVTRHVLTPKHRGLHAMLQRLRQTHPHTVVYDYTLTYVPAVKGPTTVLFGLGPKECHIHVRRFALDAIPEAEQALKDWTIETFVEKDRQLEHFSQHGRFDGPEINAPLGALDALRVLMLVVVFLLVDAAGVWAVWTFWQARVWLLVSCVSLQCWCTFAGDATLLGMPAHRSRRL